MTPRPNATYKWILVSAVKPTSLPAKSHPELPQRRRKREADRPPGGPGDDRGDDAVAGVVVGPGHDPRLGSVGQEHPAHDVHLPKRHRLVPLPFDMGPLAAAPMGIPSFFGG